MLVVCPINPFEWPVKASVAKLAIHSLTGAYKESHYRRSYFHNSGPAADARLRALSHRHRQRGRRVPQAAQSLRDSGRDRSAWTPGPRNRISEKLGGVPVLTLRRLQHVELVSILRACHMMVSSRYHGIVTSMPGLVPSAGITMDERIRNLMRERGHQDLLMNVDDPDLEPKLMAALEKLATQGAKRSREASDRPW